MSEEDKNGTEEGKKYKVVDKRYNLDEEEAPEETSGEAAPAQRADVREEAPAEEDHGGEDGEMPAIRMKDAVRMALGMIRENVFFSLGLLISKHRPKPPDLEAAGKTAELFGGLVDKFADKLGDDELGDERQPAPGLPETLDFVFRMMQGQVYMFLGLVPNPATGIVAADTAQARVGIDFCAELLAQARPQIDDARAKLFESVVSEMKMNYVNQLERTP